MSDPLASRRSLTNHLRSFTERRLAELLTIRRDGTVQPVPTTLSELADRLLQAGSLTGGLAALTLPELQVCEALAALGDGCTIPQLATLLGVPADNPDLAAALARLTSSALVWPQGDGLAADHLHVLWPDALGLGPAVADLLTDRNVTDLRQMSRTIGMPVGKTKPQMVAALAAWLGDPGNVRRLIAQAPADVRRRLDALAWEPPPPYGIFFGRPPEPLPWAAERGLVVSSWNGSNQMAREVALAIRGADYHPPFDPQPPALPVASGSVDAIEREAAAAAAATLAAITVVAETISKKPVPLLKNGGLGIRELRRLAKTSGLDEQRTRLTIEIIAAGGLTTASDSGVTLNEAYDRYVVAEPADQLLNLVGDWLTMPACPLAPTPPGSPALYWDPEEEALLTTLRSAVLRVLAAVLPEGRTSTIEAVTDQLRWHRPLLAEAADDELARFVEGIWREAHAIGLLAHGSHTEFCRRLVAGDSDEVHAHATSMTPEIRTTVVFQADLTAVVTGTPAPALLSLLDSAAAPESRSGAWTWRFSAATVRSALDAGIDPDDLRARLAAATESGQLPQPLAYLISDVARRHGQVQVHSVGCCLRSEDEALLTEILAARPLRALGLHRLAPTVVASRKASAETLSALRAAGYAPIGVQTDEAPAIQLAPRRVTAPAPSEPEPDDVEFEASEFEALELDGLEFDLPEFDDSGFDDLADPAQLARSLLHGRASSAPQRRGRRR